MPVPTTDQLSAWSSAVNSMAPWCPTNLRAACYTLATTIAAASAPSDETMEAWADQIWDIAATLSVQQWSFANTTAVAMVVQAGGDTTAITFTAAMVASGMAPNQAKVIADYFVAHVVGGFAELDSPAFVGNPTAPTQLPGDNSSRLATTAFVAAAVSALVAGAPGALDTLNELALALSDDANFAAHMVTQLDAKAPVDSPAFTTTAGPVTINGVPLSYDSAGTAVAMSVAFG